MRSFLILTANSYMVAYSLNPDQCTSYAQLYTPEKMQHTNIDFESCVFTPMDDFFTRIRLSSEDKKIFHFPRYLFFPTNKES